MQPVLQQPDAVNAPHETGRPAEAVWDGGLGFGTIMGDLTPGNQLLRLIGERIRVAAGHLRFSREDLFRIFSRHSIFEGETLPAPDGREGCFILVETHHLIQGRVGKGALKLVFPQDLAGKGAQFREAEPGVVEVVPPNGQTRWADAGQAETLVKQAMREFMTGESLSMSLKSQATGAPFAGSEGLVLCAVRQFDTASGRYWLKPALRGGDEHTRTDKELIELMMNEAAEMLTRAKRIAYDRIVHAAETNTTLTARLGLQLSTNVLEGHLRTLLREHPAIIIGDDDMTARLREIFSRKDYSPTACALARAAAKMQMEHSILLPASREKLRNLLAALPDQGSPTPAQYQALIDLFFGTGEIQQTEDQLCHHREPILKSLSTALSAGCLDECGDPQVLAFYLTTLLDNQRIVLESALLRRLPPGQPLPVDWFDRAALLSPDEQQSLRAWMPGAGATRDTVKETFWSIVNLLCEARDRVPDAMPEVYRQARAEVLARAIRAITSVGEVVPSVDRIVFFTLPLSYECATPKLGVVTRKPVDICGSELRAEAMAVGAIMALEILLKKMTGASQPLEGRTVAIEGLGNAGKNLASLMVQHGAVIVGVSDSRGAVLTTAGFTRQQLAAIIAHKNSGKRFDTFLSSPLARLLASQPQSAVTYHPNPDTLKQAKADILVLTAIPGSIHQGNAHHLQVKVVCELTGAAVSFDAKQVLKERQIPVIPDNLASSGGLLVSLSEMLQNSAAQIWDRKLEEHNLYHQLATAYDAAWTAAARHEVDLATASDIVAVQRMGALANYRERLESLSEQLAARIHSIQNREQVLVVSDNDEDGVASAAIMRELIAQVNPGAASRITFLNESFRSHAILALIQHTEATPAPIKHVFALDRAYPLGESGQANIAEVAGRCRVSLINNHELPATLLAPANPADPPGNSARLKTPAELGILLISPQTLQATVPARDFPTAMILKEIAALLVADEHALNKIAWQAAVGCCLDAPAEANSEWQLFYSQFNPDRTVEAARAVRMVTRARGFLNAIRALVGVERPDQLETHEVWERFMAEYRALDERVQVLVEKIVLENRRRPFTAHFFTRDEVASPTPIAGNEFNELDFYHWISEHLTRRGDLSQKPIIVGQVVPDAHGRRCLGVRIRSPRGVDLMEAGLPPSFQSAGLPNTAIARISFEPSAAPAQVFHKLVDEIWMKTTSPLYLSSPENSGDA